MVLDLHRRRQRRRAEPRRATPPDVKLPEQATSDIKAAAKAAGCTLNNPAYEGANHEEKDFKPSDYKTNPPTSGNHTPDWYEDGIYAPGDTPEPRQDSCTRSSTAGSRSSTSRARRRPTVGQLEALLAEQQDGYHMLLFENTTEHARRRSPRRRGRTRSPARR